VITSEGLNRACLIEMVVLSFAIAGATKSEAESRYGRTRRLRVRRERSSPTGSGQGAMAHDARLTLRPRRKSKSIIV